MYRSYVKRLFDILLSVMALTILLPLLLLIALIILITMGRPVFFLQQRVGKNGQLFTIYKFRTLPVETKEAPSKVTDVETPAHGFGKILRRTGLDELPQLFNILCGKMSLVGPRPLIPAETEMHEKRTAEGVYTIVPGLTGLAQIRCQEISSIDEKVSFDAEYVHSISFGKDMRIIIGTIGKLFSKNGIQEKIP